MLLTYLPSVLADDIFLSAANLALRRADVQVVVAWGGEPGERESHWRGEVSRWRGLGANVSIVAHPSPLERVRLTLQQPADWVLPLADDDPIAVNYLRAIADGVAQAGSETAAVLASTHLHAWDAEPVPLRLTGWPQTDLSGRLLSMLSRPGDQGTLFWGAYRHAVVAEWLAFGQALPFQPSYLDQFLPHLAACHGRIAVTAEETVLMKDDRHWQDIAAATHTDARYYPDAEMTLYHEWFWAADQWHALRFHASVVEHPLLPLAFKRWAHVMVGRMVDAFESRRRILALQPSPAHSGIVEMLKVTAGWLAGPDDRHTAVAGLDEITYMAHEVRGRWLQAGSVPDFRTELVAGAARASAVATVAPACA